MTTTARAPRTVVHSPAEIPPFASEAEEHAFWATHEMGPEFFADADWDPEFAALLPPVRKEPPARLVSVRLSEDLIARLRVLAAQRGMGYQTLLKELLIRAVAVEEQRAARAQASASTGYALPR